MLTVIKVIDPDITKLLEGIMTVDEDDVDIDDDNNIYYTHYIDENRIINGRWQSPEMGTFIIFPDRSIPTHVATTVSNIEEVATIVGDIDRTYFNLSDDEETLLNANVIK